MKISRPVLINGGLALVIVAALAVGGVFLFVPPASSDDDGTQLTAAVQQGQVSSTISASGSISPLREVSASFKVEGTISSVKVAVGDTVTKGQTLAKLNTDDLQTAVDEAYSSYVHAAQNLAAAQSQKGAQTSQINAAKDEKLRAWNAYESAKDDLAAAKLTAPISGLVVAVNGTAGDASGGSGGEGTSGLVTIADTSKYTVSMAVAEADIADVAVDQAATVTFPAITDATADATVTFVAPTASASNSIVTYQTTVTLAEVPEGLRLGQTADVAITVESSAEDALYVPSAAVTTAADGTSTVDVVDEETGDTTTVEVETGIVGDEGTEITSGLELGQTVVLGIVSADADSGEDPATTGGPGGFFVDRPDQIPGGGTIIEGPTFQMGG